MKIYCLSTLLMIWGGAYVSPVAPEKIKDASSTEDRNIDFTLNPKTLRKTLHDICEEYFPRSKDDRVHSRVAKLGVSEDKKLQVKEFINEALTSYIVEVKKRVEEDEKNEITQMYNTLQKDSYNLCSLREVMSLMEKEKFWDVKFEAPYPSWDDVDQLEKRVNARLRTNTDVAENQRDYCRRNGTG